MATITDHVVDAIEKATDPLPSGNAGKLNTALATGLLASNSVIGLLKNSRLSGYVGIGSAAYDLHKAANYPDNAGDTVGSTCVSSVGMSATGSLLAT